MSKKNESTYLYLRLARLAGIGIPILSLIASSYFLFKEVFSFPGGSPASPNKIIEEYEAQFKSLNKENTKFYVVEKTKLNSIFLDELYEFTVQDCVSILARPVPSSESNIPPAFSTYCIEFLYRFGIVELVDTQKSIRIEFIENAKIKIERLTPQYLSDLANKKSSSLELPEILYYLNRKRSENFLDTKNYTISSEPTQTFGYKKIKFSPLNSVDGYFYLIMKKNNLILKAKLCTQECPISKIETINLPKEVFDKADFQKDIDKNQDNVIKWTLGEHLEEGININYTDNQYSYFSRLFIILWNFLISNLAIFILTSAIILSLFILRKNLKKEIHIDQRQSVIAVGYSEQNTANLQGGSIVNGSEEAKVITSQSQGYENEEVIYKAERIREILKQLQHNYPIAAKHWKEDLALNAIKQIEKDPNFLEAVVRLIRENKRELLLEKISHPAAKDFCDLVTYFYKNKFI